MRKYGFVKSFFIFSFSGLVLLATATYLMANLTGHTEALLDSLLTAFDSDYDGAFTDETWYTSLQQKLSEGAFVDGDKSKLDGIEAGADVTDATNVAAAGAVMSSGLGTGVGTFLSIPSSANFFSAISDEGEYASTLFGLSAATGLPIGDTAFTDLSNGSTYTNFGIVGDDTIDELFAAVDTAIGGLAGGHDAVTLDASLSSIFNLGGAQVLTLTAWPTFNQNTTGTAANLSGTPALPNGTTATTQSAADNSTKLATTAYADTAAGNITLSALNTIAWETTARTSAPGSPSTKVMYLADGSSWDPGSVGEPNWVLYDGVSAYVNILTLTGVWLIDTIDLAGGDFTMPTIATGDTVVTEGQIRQKSHEDAIAAHGGSTGEIQDEFLISGLIHIVVPFDPEWWYDTTTNHVVPIMTAGDDFPSGGTLVQWSLSYVNGDPTTELDADLMTDTDFDPASGGTVMDVLDSTAGSSSADSGFDSATFANAGTLYVRFGADPVDSGAPILLQLWVYPNED